MVTDEVAAFLNLAAKRTQPSDSLKFSYDISKPPIRDSWLIGYTTPGSSLRTANGLPPCNRVHMAGLVRQHGIDEHNLKLAASNGRHIHVVDLEELEIQPGPQAWPYNGLVTCSKCSVQRNIGKLKDFFNEVCEA
eukprot:TRINITY_DN53187_c0_g1_i1.p2 TRINITY_DN53187_c0_g1~~TRINITY_DN53187_c0_g1_i1.p2  ORF type:complete len:135 (+),score=13.93 TRINITY_DN53187_c0_g1_i1:97-501(+)